MKKNKWRQEKKRKQVVKQKRYQVATSPTTANPLVHPPKFPIKRKHGIIVEQKLKIATCNLVRRDPHQRESIATDCEEGTRVVYHCLIGQVYSALSVR